MPRFTEEELIELAQPEQNTIKLDEKAIVEAFSGSSEPRAESLQNDDRKRAAIIRSGIEGTSPVEALMSNDRETDPTTAKRESVRRFYEDQKNLVTQELDKLIQTNQDTEAKKNLIRAGVGVRSDIDKEANSPRSEDLAVIRAAQGKDQDELSEDELSRREQLFREMAYKRIAEISDNAGIIDYAHQLVPFGFTEDLEDITGRFFGAADAMNNMVRNFNAMSPDEKAEYWPYLEEKVLDDMDNLTAAATLRKFLSPGAPESSARDVRFNQGLDLVDLIDVAGVGSLAKSTMRAINRSSKNTNAAKVYADTQNPERAGDVNAAVLTDDTGEAEEVAGMTKEQAAIQSQPVDLSEVLEGQVSGVAPESVDRVEQFQQLVQSEVEGILSGETVLREGVLTERQAKVAAQSTIETLQNTTAVDLHNVFGNMVRDMKFSRTPTGVQMQATLEHPNAGSAVARLPDASKQQFERDGVFFKENEDGTVQIVKRQPFTRDQREALDLDFINAFNAAIGNPSSFRMSNYTDDFKTQERIDLLSSRIRQKLFDLEARATSKLGNKSRRKLDALLRHFDEYIDPNTGKRGRLPTPEELKGTYAELDNGAVTEISLTDNEIEAFYKLRSLYDGMWVMKNQSLREVYESRGLRRVDIEGNPNMGKPLEDSKKARTFINRENIHRVATTNTREGVEFRDVEELGDLDQLYEEGFRFIRLEENVKAADGSEAADIILVNKNELRDLPANVLNYRDGYVPKINKDAIYFAKLQKRGTVNGNSNGILDQRTLAIFDNVKDRDSFIQWYENNHLRENEEIVSLRDSEIQGEADLGKEFVGAGAGLFTSPRAEHDIVFNTLGNKPERMDAFAAMQRNIQHLSNYVSLSEARLGVQESWIKRFNEEFGEITHIREFPDDSRQVIPASQRDTDAARVLIRTHEQIQDWSNVPHPHEQVFQNKMQRMYEWALGVPGLRRDSTPVNIIRGIRDTDPFATARSASFHTMLGMYNPIQLLVQAQGSAIALARDPQNFPGALRRYIALRNSMLSDNLTDVSAKAMGLNQKEFREFKQLFEKTGLAEGVRTNPDLSLASQGAPVGIKAVRRTFETGLIPFREGELFTRMYSFASEYLNWKKVNKGKKVDDAALRDILDETNKVMLDLGKANRAAWQRGLWSVPTQFMQVQSKILQKMLPEKLFGVKVGGTTEFTQAEKVRLWIGQMGLYGAAGFPLGNWVADMVVEQTDMDPVTLAENPELVEAVNQGFWGSFLNTGLGLDVNVSSRLSIADGVETTVVDLLTGNTTMTEFAAGAFGQVPLRAYQQLSILKPVVLGAIREREVTKEDVLQGIRGLSRITSTGRQLDRAVMAMHIQNQLVDRRGRAITTRDFSIQEELATAFGLEPKDMARARDFYVSDKVNRDHKAWLTSVYLNILGDYLGNVSVDGEVSDEDIQLARNRATTALAGYSDDVIESVMKSARRKILEGDVLDERAKRGIKAYMENTTNEVNSLLQLTRDQALIPVPEESLKAIDELDRQLDIPEEE